MWGVQRIFMPINNQNRFLYSPAALFQSQKPGHSTQCNQSKDCGVREAGKYIKKSPNRPDQFKSVGLVGFLAGVLRCRGCLNSAVLCLPAVLAGFHSVCQPKSVSLASIACRAESKHSQTHLYVHKHSCFQGIQTLQTDKKASPPPLVLLFLMSPQIWRCFIKPAAGNANETFKSGKSIASADNHRMLISEGMWKNLFSAETVGFGLVTRSIDQMETV